MSPVWRLAGKQIRSQWRKADWLTLMLSLFMMTTLVTLLTTTSDRLYNSLTAQSADIVGADIVLRSRQAIDAEKITQAKQQNLQTSSVIEFVSMAESATTNALSTVRAINNPYPLRGAITTRPAEHPAIPEMNTVWVDQSVLNRLSLSINDTLFLGYSEFRISHVILNSPDRSRGFSSFNPQIVMRQDQLEKTGIIAPGSRARYRLMAAGSADAVAATQVQWENSLQKGQQIVNASDDSQLNGNSVANASRYLKLSALLSLLLGAVAILLSLQRYSSDQRKRSALLLSLGMTPKQLLFIYTLQLFFGWLITAVLGTLLGLALHQVIAAQIGDYLPQITSLSIQSVITSPLLGLAILFIIGLPTLLPLGQTSIVQMLRKEKALSINLKHYISCALLLLLAISLYMGSVLLSIAITGLLLFLGWAAGTLAQQLIAFIVKRLQKHIKLAPLLNLRLRQQRHWHKLQAGVFSLILAIMAVLFFVRNDLVEQWQGTIPEDTPNHFAINIQPWEKERLETWMADNQIEASLFPIIRGRITHLNDQPVNDVINAEQAKTRALHRELNTTWRYDLHDSNKVVAGEWDANKAGVSIEQELSEELGLSLGDVIGLTVAGQRIDVPITSIRSVNWQSLTPNFFLIYSPELLDSFPATYITSFNIPPQAHEKSNQLIKDFPTITLIDIDKIFKQVQDIISKLADSASLIMFLTVISGGLMLLTILQQELAQRRYEGALLQTLGASEKKTRQLDLLEFCLLGITCGAIAALIAELLLAIMSRSIFDLPVSMHPQLWLTLPIIATLAFTVIGNIVRGKLSLVDSYYLIKAS